MISPRRERLAVHAKRLNPVTHAGAGVNELIRHQFTSFDSIKPLGRELGIGDRAKPAAAIYGCASSAQKQSFQIRTAISPMPATIIRRSAKVPDVKPTPVARWPVSGCAECEVWS